MPIPPPVNLSPLESILARSRQIMNVVETKNPVKQVDNSSTERSYVNEDYNYNEKDEREPEYDTYQHTPSSDPIMYTAEQVMASNLPPAIKEAMIKNPIPRYQTPPSKISAETISKITGAPIRTNQPKQQINENVKKQDSDMITISRSELKDMINEGISTFFKQVYDKTLTEETIRKTINVLIKEGKINVKKKI